jgi:recombination protein RecA
VKVVKNKVAPPFKVVDFDIMYGEGISREGSLLDMGLAHEVVQKSGAWFAYGDERLGQGRENAKLFLKENTSVRERILAEIYEKLDLGPSSVDDGEGRGGEHDKAAQEQQPAGRLI